MARFGGIRAWFAKLKLRTGRARSAPAASAAAAVPVSGPAPQTAPGSTSGSSPSGSGIPSWDPETSYAGGNAASTRYVFFSFALLSPILRKYADW